MSKVIVFIIRVYQRGVSPYIGDNCRYTPSCSQYSVEAFQKHGLVKGVILSIKRILRCHPWSKNGFDPVP